MDEIKNYFTKDIQDQIRNMTNEDMLMHLKALEGTPLWFAILKYTQNRTAVMQSSFLSLDPLKEASKISQYQGIVTGMLDLQDAVLNLKFAAEKKANPKYEESKANEEKGGAYGLGY